MQLQPSLIDLILMHELVHLVNGRHDKEFRRRVVLALPNVAELDDQLAEEGRCVWMGSVKGVPGTGVGQ
jgi:predicted metal-dependent hydrolase